MLPNNNQTTPDIRELMTKTSYLQSGLDQMTSNYNALNQTVYNLLQTRINTPSSPVANLLWNGEVGHSVNSWHDSSYVTTDKSKEAAWFFSNTAPAPAQVLTYTDSRTSSTNQTLKTTGHSTYNAAFSRWNSTNGWAELTGTTSVDIVMPSNFIDASTSLARISLISAKRSQYIEIPDDCRMYAGIWDNTVGQSTFLTGDLQFSATMNGIAGTPIERRYKLLVTSDRGFSILSPEIVIANAPSDGQFSSTVNINMSWAATAGYLQASVYEYIPSLAEYRLVTQISAATSFIHLGSYLDVVAGYPTATNTVREAVYYTQVGELPELSTNGSSPFWDTINFPIGIPNNYNKANTTDRQWVRLGLTTALNYFATECTTNGTTAITKLAGFMFDAGQQPLLAGLTAEVYDENDVLLATTTVTSWTDDDSIVLGTSIATGVSRKIRIVGGGFHGVIIDKIHLGFQQNTSYAPNALDSRTLQPIAAPSSSSQGGVGSGGSGGGIGTCVALGTPIKQESGSRKLVEECRAGERWSSGTFKPNLLGKLREGFDHIRRVRSANGIEIECTDTEKFVVSTSDYDGTPLYCLQVGDSVLTEINGVITPSKIIEKSPYLRKERVFTPSLSDNHFFIAGRYKVKNSYWQQILSYFIKPKIAEGGFVLHNAKPGGDLILTGNEV